MLVIRTVFAVTDAVAVDDFLDVIRAHHLLKIIIIIHPTPPSLQAQREVLKKFSVVDF
jgi:hypothetical protein